MQTVLYGKTKESREGGGEWFIEANAQNIPPFSTAAKQDKTKAGKAPIDEG